jgi:hypothetical protein
MKTWAYPRSKHVRRTKLVVRRAGTIYTCDDCGDRIECGEIHGHGRMSVNGVVTPRQFCASCYVEICLR